MHSHANVAAADVTIAGGRGTTPVVIAGITLTAAAFRVARPTTYPRQSRWTSGFGTSARFSQGKADRATSSKLQEELLQ